MTQYQTVLRHLRRHGNISQRDALVDYGITRLASRIDELRNSGYRIKTVMKRNPATGRSYGRYFFDKAQALVA